MDSSQFWSRGSIPTLSSNMQNCECGGVPVMVRQKGKVPVFQCGQCREEYNAPPRR